ncbi:uncharacterized protein BX663DRAFT_517510 [Cokeromyces recurvatus]|uniref:uncharacterized protein n=1 Tax=Cokeromyces recurvatus TaxID=90255 RepID=UPI002220BFB8|nr:uncharacterized protein BX663DRAFT_517510 [Cokeromyces recurvatus]KAI7900425.1 hypothetical protein BX663DRAFT_517510 [Cokeromyces recurvatus]
MSQYLSNEDYFNKQKNIKENSTSLISVYDLQDVIQQYQSQPELLKLILTSKVEEDKRRAEEARLRAKELDFYLHHHRPPHLNFISTENGKEEEEEGNDSYQIRNSSYKILPHTKKKIHQQESSSPYIIPQSHPISSRVDIEDRSSFSSMSSLSSEEEDDDEEEENYILDQRRNSAAAAMLAMGGNLFEEEQNTIIMSDHTTTVVVDEKPLTSNSNTKSRRRREMQAITKIVETREFPYIDNYFWKNNGNTVQKKTGCKSIYYKCSNSNKGCSVNKTVIARPNGEYLIKYRGSHLLECGRVERIRDL